MLPKARDLRNLSVGELDQKQTALEKERHELEQKKITGQLDKPHFFRQIRRQIAQIHTVKREKSHAG